MKNFRFLYLLLIIPLVSVFCMAGCDNTKDNKETVRLYEVTHSIFYAPLYIALNKGYFEEEGLNVELTNANGSNNVMTALLSNSADVGLAGPETSVYTALQSNGKAPKVFGQLTACDGSFLVGKKTTKEFELTDLAGKTIIGGRRGGMPAMTLQYALHLAGLENGTDYTLNLDYDFGMVASVYDSGIGDYCTMFEPTASNYVTSKDNQQIVASIGTLGGSVPYTAFIASDEWLKKDSVRSERFLRAIYRGYRFMVNSDIDDVVAALKPSFDGSSDDAIKSSVQNYLAIGAFASSPVMSADGFDRLINIIKFAGELSQEATVNFNDVCTNTYAQKCVEYFA
ncbi:MAG: ABC transporter substrate-binding protein [Clostridia bacterium]|nr:ABC transporter substrate-binding protein [Clostridia bacterium]